MARAASSRMRCSAAPMAARAAGTASGSTEIELMPNRTRCSAKRGSADGATPQNDDVSPAARLAPMICSMAHSTASSVRPTPQAAAIDRLQAGLQLPRGAHERDHELQVGELLAHAPQGLKFEGERFGVVHVAVGAPVADHRVLLTGLVAVAALQPPEDLTRGGFDRHHVTVA